MPASHNKPAWNLDSSPHQAEDETARAEVENFAAEEKHEHVKRAKQDNTMRSTIYKSVRRLVIAQLVISDILLAVYVGYAIFFEHSQISDKVFLGFLTATVVETIGLFAIITHGLFDKENWRN